MRVTDLRGRLIASGPATKGRFTYKDGPGGVYVATVSGGGPSVSRKFIIP